MKIDLKLGKEELRELRVAAASDDRSVTVYVRRCVQLELKRAGEARRAQWEQERLRPIVEDAQLES